MQKTILVAEDNRVVRLFVTEALKRSGFEVLAASSTGEALELARSAEGGIDLLLTDITLGSTGGISLAKQLRDEYPDISVLLMSGFDENSLPPLNGLSLLKKPFTAKALLQAVNRELPDS